MRPSELDFRDLRTPRQIAEANPALRPSLRWWIEQAGVNGFARNFRPVLREKCGIRGRLKNEGPIRWCGSTPLTHRTWKEAR